MKLQLKYGKINLLFRWKYSEMLAAQLNIQSKRIILGLVVLIIVAMTTAASCDFHSDFCFHKDCVLCQLAQLVLVVSHSDFSLPPPGQAGWETCLIQVFKIDTPSIKSGSVRGPPA
jgi:hypothetical protein